MRRPGLWSSPLLAGLLVGGFLTGEAFGQERSKEPKAPEKPRAESTLREGKVQDEARSTRARGVANGRGPHRVSRESQGDADHRRRAQRPEASSGITRRGESAGDGQRAPPREAAELERHDERARASRPLQAELEAVHVEADPIGTAARGQEEARVSPNDLLPPVRIAEQQAAERRQERPPTAREVAVRQRIQQRLQKQPGLSLSSRLVSVEVKGATVTLQGAVPTANEKVLVERVAASTKGVRKVDNQVKVRSGAPVRSGETALR